MTTELISRPTKLANPDFTKIIADVEGEMDLIDQGDRESKDFDHYVYEAVMEAIYGPDVWDWVNAAVEENQG